MHFIHMWGKREKMEQKWKSSGSLCERNTGKEGGKAKEHIMTLTSGLGKKKSNAVL